MGGEDVADEAVSTDDRPPPREPTDDRAALRESTDDRPPPRERHKLHRPPPLVVTKSPNLPGQSIRELLRSLGEAFEELLQENARLCQDAGQTSSPGVTPNSPYIPASPMRERGRLSRRRSESSNASGTIGEDLSNDASDFGIGVLYAPADTPRAPQRTPGSIGSVDIPMIALGGLERNSEDPWEYQHYGMAVTPCSSLGRSSTISRSLHGMILDRWDPAREKDHMISATPRFGCYSSSSRLQGRQGKRNGDELHSTGWAASMVIRPNSRRSVCWDLTSMLLLAVDILLTPMIAFGIDAHTVLPWFTPVASTFWTFDLGVQFFSGYQLQGVMELRPKKIVARYLRTSFVLDVALVTNDWLLILSGASPSFSRLLRISKGIRVVRLIRLVRLLRVIKLLSVMQQLDNVLQSQFLILSSKIIRNVSLIVMINHFVACAWYAMSQGAHDLWGYEHWAGHLLPELPDKSEPGVAYLYTTALHWAMTQFTPASMEVMPKNPLERIFTITVMMFSLLMFSSVVASMTATLTQTLQGNADHVKQCELLRRFISKHRVSVDLSSRIWGHINQQRKRVEGRPVLEIQVPLLKALPENMKQDLHTEVYTNVLLHHPLFAELAQLDASGLMFVSHTNMVDEIFTIGSYVWLDEERATKMYFVLRGDLHCFPSGTDIARWSYNQRAMPAHAGANDVLSEHAVWLLWHYAGSLVSITDVEVFTLDAAKFASIMHGGPAIRFLFAYAQKFHSLALDEIALRTDIPRTQELVASVLEEAGMAPSRPTFRTSRPHTLPDGSTTSASLSVASWSWATASTAADAARWLQSRLRPAPS